MEVVSSEQEMAMCDLRQVTSLTLGVTGILWDINGDSGFIAGLREMLECISASPPSCLVLHQRAA